MTDLALLICAGTNSAAEAFTAARERAGREAAWVSRTGLVEHHADGRLVLRGTFAGRYVEVDEVPHGSEHGSEVGFVVGAAIGFLLGPVGFAEGVLWGPQIGSRLGKPDQIEREPGLLVERLRGAVPPSHSAIVLIAEAGDVDEFARVLDREGAVLLRRGLAAEELATLETALEAWPVASSGPSLKGERAVEEAEVRDR
jgi:Protein of unknown function (DUF1269)